MSRRADLPVLSAALLAAGLLPGAPAYADHTDPPSTVTLVGSLQDELGCAEDWAPACGATRLEHRDDGTWSGTFSVPAGTHEIKIALDGGWEESYGADGGDANIPVVLSHEAALEVAYDHGSHRVSVAPAERPSDEVTPSDEAMAGDSAGRCSWRASTVAAPR